MGLVRFLRHDVGLKQQLVTVCIIATLITVFESYMFFRIVTPQVLDNVHWLLRVPGGGVHPALANDPVLADAVRVILTFANDREAPNVQENNTGAIINATMIAAFPVVIVFLLYTFSSPLRAAGIRHVALDVAVVLAGIGAFQAVFYQMCQQWMYPGSAEIFTGICQDYRAKAPNNAVADTQQALATLQTRLQTSPTVLKALTTQQQGIATANNLANALQRLDAAATSVSQDPLKSAQQLTQTLNTINATVERGNALAQTGTTLPTTPAELALPGTSGLG